MVHQHGDEHHIPQHERIHKPGAWLPADHRVHREFLDRATKHVAKHPPEKLTPALEDFRELIETNPRVYMYFQQMFDEIPKKAPYYKDPTGMKQIRDYREMLHVLNHVLTRAPEWTDAAAGAGVVGVPMCAIFDFPMGTPSGHAAFLDPDVNKALKKVLNEWGEYLKSPESVHVLDTHSTGWFGQTGMKDLLSVANAPYKSELTFEQMYKCDPSAPNFGYKSWDDFFTRELQPDARPVASPDDNAVIANSCESRPYNLERHVKLRDRFFAKGQRYSLLDMLAHDSAAHDFVGGTVYQAFLSALSYHRWHAPVSGTVRKAWVQDGTYFSEPLFEGVGEPGVTEIDSAGIGLAQGYLSALATRAIFLLEADNPDIGLMAMVYIGMDEVSTCEITALEGTKVEKGQDIGMFHFGGSSHCLVFRKGVNVVGFPKIGKDENHAVRAELCRLSGSKS